MRRRVRHTAVKARVRMESSRQIEQAAAVWLQRRDSEDWTRDHEEELQQWLALSVAHRVAFLRLEAAWEESLRLQALGAGTQRGVTPAPGVWRVSPLFNGTPVADSSSDSWTAGEAGTLSVPPSRASMSRRGWAIAAAAVIATLSVLLFTTMSGGKRYVTPVGGIASIGLPDGSSVTLNTDSGIRVDLSDVERLVRLDSGEAFFEVAKDASRPFVVVAGSKRVTAVGTKFSVRRDGENVSVIVTEGKVRVEGAGEQPLLVAGTMALASRTKVSVQEGSAEQVEEALSWRTGYLIFDATDLADAIAQFNRYTNRKIVIGDAAIAGVRVSGKFRATNSEAFVRILSDNFGIAAATAGDEIVLSAAR